MGKFIITRSAAGDRFSLVSESGRTLAVSRHYATLDACKKGIASLIINAPLMPVVDATLGEYGPNPKFEIVSATGGVAYLVKSPNGKTVITSPDYATKKACLRAISMLRTGVLDVEILLYNKARYTPIVMKALDGITPQPPVADPTPSEEPPVGDSAPTPCIADITPSEEPPVEDSAPTPRFADPTPEAPVATPPARPVGTPRLIRLQPKAPSCERPTAQKSESERTLGGILGRFFKK